MPGRFLHSDSRKMGSLEKLPVVWPWRQEALSTSGWRAGREKSPLKYCKDQFRAEMCIAQMV